MKIFLIFFASITFINSVSGQSYSGSISAKKSGQPLPYVNVGIEGKDIGTVSNSLGNYKIYLDSLHNNDTLKISSVGYSTYSIRIADFKQLKNHSIELEEKSNELSEVIIQPKKYKLKTLGNTTKSKFPIVGFKENMLGYECGILIHVKKTAILQRVNINFAKTSYDSLFYRINIYKVVDKKHFENILHKPIYLKLSKADIEEKVIIDVTANRVFVRGDFLITVEHIKDLGPGYLYFYTALLHNAYFRKTSQGNWATIPFGLSISVDAKVER